MIDKSTIAVINYRYYMTKKRLLLKKELLQNLKIQYITIY